MLGSALLPPHRAFCHQMGVDLLKNKQTKTYRVPVRGHGFFSFLKVTTTIIQTADILKVDELMREPVFSRLLVSRI